MDRIITEAHMKSFHDFLVEEEKSPYTIEKYIRDVKFFAEYVQGQSVTKEIASEYKQQLIARNYATASINSMLASLRSFFSFMEWSGCSVRSIREQRKIYCPEEKELTRDDYIRLLNAAEDHPRLQLIIETICATGIRVSELKYFTVENVRCSEVSVNCKSKTRIVFIPGKLRKKLLAYCRKQKIDSGIIFKTQGGRPVSRTNIWSGMKLLCKKAGVSPSKVFPHNLRKLFARTFYKDSRDIARLADILGHTSINTTRIYIVSTGREHRRSIENMRLVI